MPEEAGSSSTTTVEVSQRIKREGSQERIAEHSNDKDLQNNSLAAIDVILKLKNTSGYQEEPILNPNDVVMYSNAESTVSFAKKNLHLLASGNTSRY